MKSSANRVEFERPSIRDVLSTDAGRREFDEMFAWLRKRGVGKFLLDKTRALLEPESSPMNYPLAIEILQAVEDTAGLLSINRRPHLVVSNERPPRR